MKHLLGTLLLTALLMGCSDVTGPDGPAVSSNGERQLRASTATLLPGHGGRPLETTMVGAEEAPNPGDPDGVGTAYFTLNPGQEEICYALSVSGIEPARAAHIHIAPPGSPGPVVVPLVAPTEGTSSGCVSVDRALVKAILQHPENYYVNVHNAPYPGGALRGQLGK